VYIGITKNTRKRWLEHSHAARCGSKCVLHKAICKYGFDSFKKEILLTSTFSYVKDLEVKAIAAYSTMVPAGYNMTAGGDGTVGYIFTDKDKMKIGLAHKGRKHSEESKRICSHDLHIYLRLDFLFFLVLRLPPLNGTHLIGVLQLSAL
jgi:group I intron endonuclease